MPQLIVKAFDPRQSIFFALFWLLSTSGAALLICTLAGLDALIWLQVSCVIALVLLGYRTSHKPEPIEQIATLNETGHPGYSGLQVMALSGVVMLTALIGLGLQEPADQLHSHAALKSEPTLAAAKPDPADQPLRDARYAVANNQRTALDNKPATLR